MVSFIAALLSTARRTYKPRFVSLYLTFPLYFNSNSRRNKQIQRISHTTISKAPYHHISIVNIYFPWQIKCVGIPACPLLEKDADSSSAAESMPRAGSHLFPIHKLLTAGVLGTEHSPTEQAQHGMLGFVIVRGSRASEKAKGTQVTIRTHCGKHRGGQELCEPKAYLITRSQLKSPPLETSYKTHFFRRRLSSSQILNGSYARNTS